MSGTTRIASEDFDRVIATDLDSSDYDPDFLFKVDPRERLRDKVAIVGFTDHRVEALKLDPDEYELWGLNELYRYMPPERFHRWFEIHGRDYLAADEEGQKHIEDLKTALGPLPIYMQSRHDDIGGSVRFPIDEIIDGFGGREAPGADYYTNCPAMMVAFAITLGFKELRLYGIDMATASEYATQRCNCEFWLGRALGLGIEVYVPPTSDLLKCIGTYGYEGRGSALSRKLQERIKYGHKVDNEHLAAIRKLEADYQHQHATLTARIHGYEGAIAELGTWRRTRKLDDRITALTAELESTKTDRARLENEYQAKHSQLKTLRDQCIGGVHEDEYLLQAWSMKADNPAGGNVPSAAVRAEDPKTGIAAPSGDSRLASAPALLES